MLHYLESALRLVFLYFVCLGLPWDNTEGALGYAEALEQALVPETPQHVQATSLRLQTFPFATATWSSWTVCDGEHQKRSRTCSRRRYINRFSPYENGLCVQTRSCQARTERIEMWTEWGQWSNCDASGADSVRIRKCIKSNNQFSPNFSNQYTSSLWLNKGGCVGLAYQTKSCKAQVQTDPSWSEWQPWSSCVWHQRHRVRTCLWGNCVGNSAMTERCQQGEVSVVTTAKPEDRYSTSHWLEWDAWSGCTDLIETRKRECSGTACPGFSAESKACGSRIVVSDGWSAWSSWSSCQVDVEMRSRSCLQGRRCFGAAYQQRACSTGDVSGQGYTPWASWSQCVSGKQTRVRRCLINNNPSCRFKGYQVRACFSGTEGDRDGNLPVGEWTYWSEWSQCAKGLRIRSRKCDNKNCRGYSDEVQNCFPVTPRPLVPSPASTPRHEQPPGWAEWGPWEAACYYGKQWRRRSCLQDRQSRMTNCTGPNSKSRPCMYH